jgi:hypothetical protein
MTPRISASRITTGVAPRMSTRAKAGRALATAAVLTLAGVSVASRALAQSAPPVPQGLRTASDSSRRLATALNDSPLAVACRAPVDRGTDLYRALPILVQAMPAALRGAAVDLRFVPFSGEAGETATKIAGFDPRSAPPTLSWAPGVHGATLLHEMAHAAQYSFTTAQLTRTATAVMAADSSVGFSGSIVWRSAESLRFFLHGIAGPDAAVALARLDAGLSSGWSVLPTATSAPRAGSLHDAAQAVLRTLSLPELVSVRRALAAPGPGRFGWAARRTGAPWGWDDEVIAVLTMETMAYDTEERCRHGEVSAFWATQVRAAAPAKTVH